MKGKAVCGFIVLVIGLLSPGNIQAQGTTYLSNLGHTSTGSMAVGSDSWLAADLRTGFNSSGYLLDSVDLAMGNATGNPNGLAVMIYSAITGVAVFPGSSLGTLNGSENPTTTDVYNYVPTSATILSANTHYFIVLVAGTATNVGAYGWSITGTPTGSSNGWTANYSLAYSSNGSSWSFLSGDLAQFALTATPIPEPGVLVLLVLAGLGFLWRRSKARRFR